MSGEEGETEKKNDQSPGFDISQNALAVLILISVLFLFLIGMLGGFVFRKINACEPVYPDQQVGGSTASSASPATGSSSPAITFPSVSTGPTTTAGPTGICGNPRLPSYIEPTNYNLKLKIDFDPSIKATDGTAYEGTVDISFNLKESTNDLIFHLNQPLRLSNDVVVTNVASNQQTTVSSQASVVNQNYFCARLGSTLSTGNYKLTVSFRLDSSLYENKGIFAEKYLDDLIERTLVATELAPTDARRVFPSFDEPQLKATFDITIQHPLNTFAVSNAPVESVTQATIGDKVYQQTKFRTTPKLSTYTVGWVVLPSTDYEYVESTTTGGIPVRVYGKRNAKQLGLLDLALDTAVKSVNYLVNYLGYTESVSPKIDLISISNYPFEALESYGVSILRESSVYYSSTLDTASTKQTVALAVANQIAQLWFGGVVTSSWWDDLWFNKGAAGYLKYKIVDSIYSAWNLDLKNQFIVEETVPVMWDDGYASSHPLQVKVNTNNEIISTFDRVTISKGAAIMRMVESVVGETQFQNGLRNYINKNKYGLGVLSDFYGSFTLPAEMSSTTPAQFLSSWIGQMNYPIIEVQLVPSGQNTIFNFEQDRFLLTIYDEEIDPIYTSPYGYKWQVLVKCKAGGIYNPNGGESQHLQGSVDDIVLFLTDTKASITKNNRLYTWIKCNQNFDSYYTTEYSRNVYEAFVGALQVNYQALAPADRANLLHTTYQVAYRGDFSYSVPASLSNYLAYRETDYVAWKVFMYHINIIANLLEHRPVYKQLADYGEGIVESLRLTIDLYQETNNQKPHTQLLLEQAAVEFLCRLQEEDCLNRMSEHYSKISEQYFANPNGESNPIAPNLRAAVYKYHLQNTYNYNDWFDVYQLYELTTDAQEKNNALLALTGSRSTWLLNLYLAELLDRESHVKKQDFFSVLNAISKNPSGRHLGWYFYRHYWPEMVEIFTLEDFAFGQSIKEITETFETVYLLDDMRDFFVSHPSAGSGIFARQQAIDVVENNIFWVFDRENDIANNLLDPTKKI